MRVTGAMRSAGGGGRGGIWSAGLVADVRSSPCVRQSDPRGGTSIRHAWLHALSFRTTRDTLDVRIPLDTKRWRSESSMAASSLAQSSDPPSRFFDRSTVEFTSSKSAQSNGEGGVDELFEQLQRLSLRSVYVTDRNRQSDLLIWSDYVPPEHVKPTLPASTSYKNVFLSLKLNIANNLQENAWQSFVEHLQNIDLKREKGHLDDQLYDGLFWLLASESTRSATVERHEELFYRITVMLEYADAFNVRPTALQIRRMTYVWIELCKRKKTTLFPDVPARLIDSVTMLDGQLASSLIAILAQSGQLQVAFQTLKSWKARDSSKAREHRSEVFEEDGTSVEDVHRLTSGGEALGEEAWSSVLECCIRLRETHVDDAKSVGWYALQHGSFQTSFRLVQSYLAAFVPRQKLIDMLPESLRRHLGKRIFRPTEAQKAALSPINNSFGHLDEAMRVKLLLPVSTLLARQRKDARVAEWMLDRMRNQSRWMMNKEANDLFCEGANASASSALSSILKPGPQFVDHIRLSIRFLESCERHTDLSAPGNLIHALQQHVKEHHGFSPNVMPLEQWRTLVRRLSAVLIRQDHRLGVWTAEYDIHTLRHLISFHVTLRDFPFAKRLFRIYSARQSKSKRSIFNPKDFLWMFQKALEQEKLVLKEGLLWSLFMHWYTTVLRIEYMPKLPTSLVRTFVGRNNPENTDDIPFLLQCMSMFAGPGTSHSLMNQNQSERLIKLLCTLPYSMLSDSMPFILQVLNFTRAQKYAKHMPHIIQLHSRVIVHLCQHLERSGVWQRAECLAMFETLRTYAKQQLSEEVMTAREDRDLILRPLLSAYLSALQVMRYESSTAVGRRLVYKSSAKANDWGARINEVIDELASYWKVDLSTVDRASDAMPITSAKLASYIFAGELTKANELYADTMNAFAKRQEPLEQSADKDWPVPAASATRLALSMGRAGMFNEAHEVLALYLRSLPPSSESEEVVTPPMMQDTLRSLDDDDGDYDGEGEEQHAEEQTSQDESDRLATLSVRRDVRSLIEVAGVSLLCMRGRTQEALDRIYSLYRLGVLGPVAHDPTSRLSTEHRGDQRVPGSPFLLPFHGPSNASLSQIFTLALQRNTLNDGDWKGEIQTAQKQLQTLTGAEDVRSAPPEVRLESFLDEREEGQDDGGDDDGKKAQM